MRFLTNSGLSGRGYQASINQALREYLEREKLETVRRVLREELEEGALSGVHPWLNIAVSGIVKPDLPLTLWPAAWLSSGGRA